jgi:hypothetical protein
MVSDLFSCFDLPPRMLLLVVFYDRVLSIPTPYFSFSSQMTIIRLILLSSHLHHLHQVVGAFRSRRGDFLLFLIHSLTVLRDIPNVLFSPRKLLRFS